MGRLLNLEEDLDQLTSEEKENISQTIKKKKLTPLEFTILELIIKYPNGISGYDLMDALNKHFAGTWEAQSGTIYPLLSKLKSNGFLKGKNVKSPIGPVKKVYSLTEIGKMIIETKVNLKCIEQLKFIENFTIELLSIYLKTIKDEEKQESSAEIYKLINDMFNNIFQTFFRDDGSKLVCSNCKTEIYRRESIYCFHCGSRL